MALEEISFYNMIGEEVNITNLVEQMIDYYDQKREIGETRVTDFNEGSEIRNLLEAFAVLCYAILEDTTEATKLPFISTSYGTYLDRIGENPFINLPRITGSVSEGEVTFTLATAQSTDIIIPAETLLETNGGLQFITLVECIIDAGETSNIATAECLTEGADGNINSGALTIISEDSIDTDLVSVTNDDPFINGSDYEDDEVYRERLLENVREDGFGTIGYYVKLCNEVDGVHDVKFVADSTYTRKCLVNGYTRETPSSVLLDVVTELSDVNSIVLGHSFTVGKPDYTTALNLTFTLDVLSEQDTDNLSDLVTAIVYGGDWDRVTFPGLNIGEDLTKETLVNGMSVLDAIQGVSVVVTGGSSEFDSTSVDVDEVVKLGTLSFTQNIVG